MDDTKLRFDRLPFDPQYTGGETLGRTITPEAFAEGVRRALAERAEQLTPPWWRHAFAPKPGSARATPPAAGRDASVDARSRDLDGLQRRVRELRTELARLDREIAVLRNRQVGNVRDGSASER